METLRELDVLRAASLRTTLRADQRAEDDTADAAEATSDGLGTLEVRFSPYGVWYEIDSWFEGQFLERTVKGAFKKTMSENRNVVTLFNHGMDFHIGDKVLGAITDLREDDDSAVLEANLFDTSYNRDLAPGLRAGTYGSSFMFRVIQDEWNDEPGTSEWNPKGLPERTIKEVRLYEAGPVTFPANPDATAGLRSVRSMTDEYYELLRSREPQRVEALRSRVTELRTRSGREAVQSTPDEEPVDTLISERAAESPEGPDSIHPTGLSPAQRARALRELAHPFLKETG